MKHKILRRSINIKTQRDIKKRNRLTMKLADQFIRLKVKEKAFMRFLEAYLGPGTYCPVSLESFSQDDPPYKLSSCEHRLSLTVLCKLNISYKKNSKSGTSYLICPVCKIMTLFAHIDNSYLRAVKLMEYLKIVDTLSTSEVLPYLGIPFELPNRADLTYFNPTGGILELWEKICFT